jgi:DNA repair protein RecO
MHHIYETDAYVLKTIPQGEADMFVSLFTESLGMIRATAKGIRYEKSKLRFAVQDYARVTVSLVRGKGTWRLTNAQTDTLLANALAPDALGVIARVFKLLERLLSGEEADPTLFALLDGGIEFLKTCTTEEMLRDTESVLVLRLLHQLGYVGNDASLNFYILENRWDTDIIEKIKTERIEVLKTINQGIRESQL